MKAIHTFIAALGLATAVAPALAAEGVPADLQSTWAATAAATGGAPAGAPAVATGAQPQYLPGLGELTVVRNPAFVSPRVERTDKAEIRRQSAPATRYVGA